MSARSPLPPAPEVRRVRSISASGAAVRPATSTATSSARVPGARISPGTTGTAPKRWRKAPSASATDSAMSGEGPGA